LCGGQIDVMGLGIKRHCARSTLRNNGLYGLELAWRRLPHLCQSAISIGAERQSCFRIETISVNTVANRHNGNYFAGLRVQDGHDLVVASGIDAVMLRIKSHSGGSLARL